MVERFCFYGRNGRHERRPLANGHALPAARSRLRSRPDGTPRKLLDSSRIQALGWSATTPLEEGLKLYYDWFLSNQGKLRETVIEAAISE